MIKNRLLLSVTFIGLLISCNLSAQSTELDSLPDDNFAKEMYEKAKLFTQKANYDSSDFYLTKSKIIYLQKQDWGRYIKCLNSLAHNALIKNEFDKAEEILNEVEKLSVTKFVNGHPILSKFLNIQGRLKNRQGKADIAIELFERAIANEIKFKGDDSQYLGNIYNELAVVYMDKGEYDESERLLNKAMEKFSEPKDENPLELALIYRRLGNIYFFKGEYHESIQLYEKSLVTVKKIRGDNHPSVAATYDNIGMVLSSMGKYDEALTYHEDALNIKDVLGDKNLDLATTYENIGIVYHQKGDYENALKYFNNSLSIRLSLVNKEHRLVGLSYLNLGYTYLRMGDYDKALDFYLQATNLFKNHFGEEHYNVAAGYGNLGGAYLEKNEFESALVFFKKSAKIFEKIAGPNHPLLSKIYADIGLVYRNIGDYERSIESFELSLGIMIPEFGEDNFEVAKTYGNIGRVYHKLGNESKALELQNKALRILSKSTGEGHPLFGETLMHIGTVLEAENKFEMALSYYQKSVASFVKGYNETSNNSNPNIEELTPEIALLESLIAKANILIKIYNQESKNLDDVKNAISTFELIFNLISKIRVGYRTTSSELDLVSNTASIYDNAIKAALLLYEKTKDEKYKLKAFLFAERSKSNLLLAAISDSKAKSFSNIPDSLLVRERKLKYVLANYDRLVLEEQQKGGQIDSLKLNLWLNKRFDLNEEYDKIIKDFEVNYPDYYNLKYEQKTLTVQNIQSKILNQDAVLVEYFQGEDNIYIFVITSQKYDVVTIDKPEFFDQYIELFRSSIFGQTQIVERQERGSGGIVPIK